jgi:hypothetical protein
VLLSQNHSLSASKARSISRSSVVSLRQSVHSRVSLPCWTTTFVPQRSQITTPSSPSRAASASFRARIRQSTHVRPFPWKISAAVAHIFPPYLPGTHTSATTRLGGPGSIIVSPVGIGPPPMTTNDRAAVPSGEASSMHSLPDLFALLGHSVETMFLLVFGNTKLNQLSITKFPDCA